MIKKQVLIGLTPGLESRIASEFVRKASSFSSNISLIKNEREMAAKSIMGVMASAIRKGDTITLTASGSDEAEAISVLEDMLANRLDN